MTETTKTETSELVSVAEETGLTKTEVEGLLAKFGEPFANAQDMLKKAAGIVVTDESQTDEMKKAREMRLKLRAIRVQAEHTRKELKESVNREGKAIDGMANIIKAMIVPAEEKLEQAEKFAENLAAERKQRISAERLSILLELTDTPMMYSFETMEQDVFDKLVVELTTARDNKIAAEKKAAEEKAAADKKAAEEAEKMRAENAKLKAEAEAREAAIAKERKEAADKAAADVAAANAKATAEREAREAAEKVAADKKAEDDRIAAAAEEEKRKALLAPDRDKLMVFADQIDKLELPALQNRDASKLLDETRDYLGRISKNLRQKAKEL